MKAELTIKVDFDISQFATGRLAEMAIRDVLENAAWFIADEGVLETSELLLKEQSFAVQVTRIPEVKK